jgi:hypothetical protein
MDKEGFQRIRKAIDQHHDWPGVYMFKFIVPAANEKLAQVQALFNSNTAQITTRPSSKGNFIALTAREVMVSADQVMEKYMKAAMIEGVIAL